MNLGGPASRCPLFGEDRKSAGIRPNRRDCAARKSGAFRLHWPPMRGNLPAPLLGAAIGQADVLIADGVPGWDWNNPGNFEKLGVAKAEEEADARVCRQALWRWRVAELNFEIVRHYRLVMIPGACDKKADERSPSKPALVSMVERGFPLQRTGSSVAARSPHRPRRRQRVGALSDRPPEAPG